MINFNLNQFQLPDHDPSQSPDSLALQSHLSTTLTPLILHSLFSIPSNWAVLRPHLSASLPFPTNLYTPEVLRAEAKQIVLSNDLLNTLWGTGGVVESDQETDRRRQRLLLGKGGEAWTERDNEKSKENKKEMKATFDRDRVIGVATIILQEIETNLRSSSTAFFFSSTTAQTLDIQLHALLSPVVFQPLPQPLLLNLLHAKFPLLLAHVTLLNETLATSMAKEMRVESFDYIQAFRAFLPSLGDLLPKLTSLSRIGIRDKKPEVKKTKGELEFEKRRLFFGALVGIGLVGWRVLSTSSSGSIEPEREEGGEWEEA